jgi:hypothetical protein
VARLEAQRQALAEEAALQGEWQLILGRLEDFAAKLHDGLETADWASKRDLIRALVKRVEVARNEVNIVFRIDPYPSDDDPEKKSLQLCRGRDDAPLWSPSKGFLYLSLVQDSCTQEFPEEVSDVPVCYAFLDRLDEPPMRYGVKVAGYVAFNHPLVTFSAIARESVPNDGHSVIGASIWPEAIRVCAEVCFPYGF